jgi:hypothetical protein
MLPTKFRFIWDSSFRGEDLKKLANQKQELPMAAMFVNGSGQNEQSFERTFHRCFLPSFVSSSWGVSEEKIKMWKVNGRQVMAKAHIAFGKVSYKIKWNKNNSLIIFLMMILKC